MKRDIRNEATNYAISYSVLNSIQNIGVTAEISPETDTIRNHYHKHLVLTHLIPLNTL